MQERESAQREAVRVLQSVSEVNEKQGASPCGEAFQGEIPFDRTAFMLYSTYSD